MLIEVYNDTKMYFVYYDIEQHKFGARKNYTDLDFFFRTEGFVNDYEYKIYQIFDYKRDTKEELNWSEMLTPYVSIFEKMLSNIIL